jgi:DNA-directed RNA polymerase sigma subunit (sigma70/sigma32)
MESFITDLEKALARAEMDLAENLASAEGNLRISQRDLKVMRMYFIEGVSLEEVGTELGLCKERVRQLRDKAMLYLKENHYLDIQKY